MKHLLLLTCFFLLSKLNSQELFFSKPAVFQHLPSIETYQVLQDSKGFIWITTDLSKFSILIRNILNNSRQEYIFLAQEISTLQSAGNYQR